MSSSGPSPHSEWIYQRWLGWYEYDEDNQRVPVVVAVYKSGFGLNVFLVGSCIEHLKWFALREEAIEFAVDSQRELAAEHEVSQYEQN